jgi:hypothetical protein
MAVLRFFIPWQRVIGLIQSRGVKDDTKPAINDFTQL